MDSDREWGPVEEDGRYVGVLSTRDVLTSYRRALAGNVRRMRSVGTSKGTMVEADVAPGSALVGVKVSRAPWPRDTVLVSIERDEEIIVPRGDVVIEGDDRLTLFVTTAGREPLLALLADPAIRAGEGNELTMAAEAGTTVEADPDGMVASGPDERPSPSERPDSGTAPPA